MYVPTLYAEPSAGWARELIVANPLALLTSCGGAEPSGDAGRVPSATHLPLIPEPGVEPAGQQELIGTTLWGHMNRANPHWTSLAGGGAALAVFTGPHGYVSPTVYQGSPCAPTWDFTAVHVRGRLTPVAPGEATLEILRATVRALERVAGTTWDMTDSLGYFQQLEPGVRAFHFLIEEVSSMFKLSQEQCPERRERVRAAFGSSTHGRHREVAHLMTALPDAPHAGGGALR